MLYTEWWKWFLIEINMFDVEFNLIYEIFRFEKLVFNETLFYSYIFVMNKWTNEQMSRSGSREYLMHVIQFNKTGAGGILFRTQFKSSVNGFTINIPDNPCRIFIISVFDLNT